MEISKELISKVLEIDKRLLRIDEIKENHIFFYTMSNVGEYQNYINIYELAFKCKEWAYSKCNEIISYTEGCEIFQTQMGEKIKDFYADTEIEAIFKACQWILDNK